MITTIWELFDVKYWQKVYHNKEFLLWENWNNILISSKWEDNWVYWFFDIENYFKAPFITVPSTWTVWQAFIQEIDCSVDDNCLVLIPKIDFKYSLSDLYSIAFQIRKTKWKYRYWRQITPNRIKEQDIVIEDLKIDVEKRTNELLPKEKDKKQIEENKNIKLVKLTDLCIFEKKTALPQNQLELDWNIPYVTTSSKDNWVSNFVFEEVNSIWKCLTVAFNWSVWETFFQFNDFITSWDNVVIRLKWEYNPYLLFYIGYFIKKEKWRYNYYRKLSLWKLEKYIIPMPYIWNNIDIELIKKLFENSYWSDLLKKYL